MNICVMTLVASVFMQGFLWIQSGVILHPAFKALGYVTDREMTEQASDTEIIRKVLDGQTNLYEILIERYTRYVFAVVQKYVPAEVASEVAHITFVEAFKGLGRLKNPESFRSWLATVAVRRSYDYWRDKKRNNNEVPVSALSERQTSVMEREGASAAEEVFKQENDTLALRATLNQALEQLSPEDRMVIVLMYFEDHTVAEAAKILDWSVANTKVRALRARNKLKDLLKDVSIKRGS